MCRVAGGSRKPVACLPASAKRRLDSLEHDAQSSCQRTCREDRYTLWIERKCKKLFPLFGSNRRSGRKDSTSVAAGHSGGQMWLRVNLGSGPSFLIAAAPIGQSSMRLKISGASPNAIPEKPKYVTPQR